MSTEIFTLGIVGVRGYVGKELLAMVARHPSIKVEWISSRQLQGQPASTLEPALEGLTIESLSPAQVATKGSDVVVLALPNGLAAPFVEAIEQQQNTRVLIDLSADYRFDPDWIYSLPELDNDWPEKCGLNELIKLSNPGCYATAMQLALAPVIHLLNAKPNCFGVSGYSGAGTKPSPNNDPENLKDNLVGYTLVEHLHEKEVSDRLKTQVMFSPHVAAFFRGINMTLQVEFETAQTAEGLLNRFNDFYANNPLVKCQKEIPTVKQIANTPDCVIGGFSVSSDGKRATLVSCVDNLLKGAASQAMQNINLALKLDESIAITQ